MKNRDNEFFREEELDELVEKRDYETLRDKMSRIFACPCCLNGFKHCRKYLEVFSKEEIRKTPTLAAAEAVIQAIYGNLEKVENELHKEPPDHVLESVSRLVSAEQPVWTGSPSALADAVHVGMAANALSKYLNVKSGRLLDEYHVRYENKVRHEGRRITLTYDAESK